MKNEQNDKVGHIDWFECSFVDQDIVLMKYQKDVEVDLTKAKELVNYRLSFASHKDHFLLIDMSNVKHVDADARNFLQNENGLKNIKGAAFVADNPVALLLANIFNKTNTNFMSRIFERFDDALDWLSRYRDGKL